MRLKFIVGLLLFCSVSYGATFNDLPEPVQTLINALDVSIKFNCITAIEEQADFNKYTVNLLLFKDASTCENANYMIYYDKTTFNCYWLNNTPQPINALPEESFTEKIMTWSNGYYIELKNLCESKKKARILIYKDDDNDGIATPTEEIVYENKNGEIVEGLRISE